MTSSHTQSLQRSLIASLVSTAGQLSTPSVPTRRAIMHLPCCLVRSSRMLNVPIWGTLPSLRQSYVRLLSKGCIGAQIAMSTLLCKADFSFVHRSIWPCMVTILLLLSLSRSEQLLSCAACSSSTLSLSASEPQPDREQMLIVAATTRRAANREKLLMRHMGRLLSFTGRGSLGSALYANIYLFVKNRCSRWANYTSFFPTFCNNDYQAFWA